MSLSLDALLSRLSTQRMPKPGARLDEKTVRHELEGNICRCTGYHNIVKSVLDAAERMAGPTRAAAE